MKHLLFPGSSSFGAASCSLPPPQHFSAAAQPHRHAVLWVLAEEQGRNFLKDPEKKVVLKKCWDLLLVVSAWRWMGWVVVSQWPAVPAVVLLCQPCQELGSAALRRALGQLLRRVFCSLSAVFDAYHSPAGEGGGLTPRHPCAGDTQSCVRQHRDCSRLHFCNVLRHKLNTFCCYLTCHLRYAPFFHLSDYFSSFHGKAYNRHSSSNRRRHWSGNSRSSSLVSRSLCIHVCVSVPGHGITFLETVCLFKSCHACV